MTVLPPIREIYSADSVIVIDTVKGRLALRVRVEEIDIAKLKGYAPEKLVDHSKVGVRTVRGSGLRGGGDATKERQLCLDLENLETVELKGSLSIPAGAGKVSVEDLNSYMSHETLREKVPGEHVNHKGLEVEAGVGLSGGGDLMQSVTLRLALQRLERVPPTDDMFIPVVDGENLHAKVSVRDLFELFRQWEQGVAHTT